MLNLPPEDQLRALLKLIYFATLEARAEAWQGEHKSEGASKDCFTKIARLMDAIHNIPGHLTNYDSWNQHCFEICLGSKETELGSWLHKVYSNALKEAKTQGEQGGTGQPATRPVDEPEGGDKPQPEAEGRTR